ncbi:MAG: hypothetical protein HN875_02360 [Candidatus Nitrosopelagicus sp.]|jgi:hypothetical protein|nr:hypothetical protein [Candidatus Nitrosopelagicus sp.]
MALPTGNENSGDTARPNMSRLMIPSQMLPENYSFDPDMMDGYEMEYGDGKKFQTTTLFWKLPVLATGEEILWSYVGEEGIFNKKARHVMAVTNFRAYLYDFNDYEHGNLLISNMDDVLIMNSHRQSSSHRMGSFHSTGRMGMRIGTHSSMSSSRSQTVGDVHFMKDGESFIIFEGVSDPQGIVRVVKSIKKYVIVRDKVDESVKAEGLEDVDNRTVLEIIELYNDGEIDKCLKLCDKTLEKTPNQRIYDVKAGLLDDAGKWKELVVASRKMLSRTDSESAFENLMVGLIRLDKTNDAIDELSRGLKLYPENTVLLDLKKQLDDFETNNLLDNITCPKCKKENESNSKFCNKCGAKFDDGCEKCGNVNPKNSKFCNGCGNSLS